MMGITEKGDQKYAAVTFSSSATVNFKFLPYCSAANEIKQIPYPGGWTNTQDGLTEAKKLFDDPASGIVKKCEKNMECLKVAECERKENFKYMNYFIVNMIETESEFHGNKYFWSN